MYCDRLDSVHRQRIQTTFLHVFVCLSHWLAPFICFTAEEAWAHFGKDVLGFSETDPEVSFDSPLLDCLEHNTLYSRTPFWSIHLSHMPTIPEAWQDEQGSSLIDQLFVARSCVTEALELSRAKKEIGDSLQACPKVYVHERYRALPVELLKEFCVTSDMEIVYQNDLPEGCYSNHPEVGVIVQRASGQKCDRCWKILPEVVLSSSSLCKRCEGAGL